MEGKIKKIIEIKTKKTAPKVMEIGEKKYIDPQTGEEIEVLIVKKNFNTDIGFWKVWLQDILAILDHFGNKKIKIVSYLLSKMRREDNSVTVTYNEITKNVGVSKPTVSAVIRELIEANIIKKIAPATYIFNPAIIVKGTSAKRMRLMVEYNTVDSQYEDERDKFFEPKALIDDIITEEKEENRSYSQLK
jgi:DNA-binding Lrp family transcriptional regulator